MKSLSVAQQSKASRRALMLGLTLAEIMLFLLFALLLLIGAKSEEEAVASSWAELVGQSLIDKSAVSDAPSEEVSGALTRLFEALDARRLPEEDPQDTWTRIGTYLRNEEFNDTSALNEKVAELEDQIQRQAELNEQLAEAAEESDSYAEALREQLDITRGGATPPCLYGIADSGEGLRGPSVPIGLVRIEDDLLVFEEIYWDRLASPLVDFWGQVADTSNLVEYLETLPIGSALATNRFHSLASPIKAIGDIDTEEHGRCLFTADYAMDDFTPLRMFTQVFQAYFLPQQRQVIEIDE